VRWRSACPSKWNTPSRAAESRSQRRIAMRRHRISESEVSFTAVRSQGAGGQNVNKVSSAVQLRFDLHASSLPEAHKARLLALGDQRISADGVVVIKAQTHRSQPLNRVEAMQRLQALVDSVALPPKKRVPTQPTLASKRRRLESKLLRAQTKAGRRSQGPE
jgi:ribosome-associated protein